MPSQVLFCFTIDTEPDNLWANAPTITFEHFRRLPEFHARICTAGARPTYLTTSEVAENSDARQAMEACRERYPCEIGAHFHSWTREWPFAVPDLGTPRLCAMAHQLGQPIEEAMLAFTCGRLRSAFAVEPKSYRGGRWSLGPESERSLKNCGIEVDSSVAPGMNWQDSQHVLEDGPDYRRASRYPQPLASVFHQPAAADGVLEIPVGAAWFPSWAEHLSAFARRQLSRAGRLSGLRLGHRWLRPSRVNLPDMIATMKSLLAANVPVLVFMIHSSEIMCCNPLPTQEHVDAFVKRCEDAVSAAVALGLKPATLIEAAREIQTTSARAAVV